MTNLSAVGYRINAFSIVEKDSAQARPTKGRGAIDAVCVAPGDESGDFHSRSVRYLYLTCKAFLPLAAQFVAARIPQ